MSKGRRVEIQYLKHHQIDKQKWDSAIENAANGLVYALSWYLDIVSPKWDALITDNYEMVMPITLRSKLGIKYFYKPVFVQFLGVFSKKVLHENIIEQFIQIMLKKVNLIDIWLNPNNPLKENDFYIKRRTQELSLKDSYQTIYSAYSRSNKINLSKAENNNLKLNRTLNIDNLLFLLKEMYDKKKLSGVNKKDYKHLNDIITTGFEKGIGEYYEILYNNELCSAAFFLNWGKRSTIFFATSNLGREKRSIFSLIDYFIRDHAGQDIILDFAGSNIPGVAYINNGFGAKDQNYYSININNLHPIIKLFKS